MKFKVPGVSKAQLASAKTRLDLVRLIRDPLRLDLIRAVQTAEKVLSGDIQLVGDDEILTTMQIIPMEPIPPNSNPYLSDAYNTGITIGKNVEVMMGNLSTEECKYLIIVNKETGERLRVIIKE